MSAITKLSLFVFLILTYSSCTRPDTNSATKSRTIISGKITSANTKQQCNKMVVQITDFRGKDVVYIDSLQPDNSFHIEFDLYKTQDVNLLPLVGRILVNPGDSIYINLDLNRIENSIFESSSKINNKKLVEYLHSNYSSFKTRNAHTSKMTPSAYKSYLNKQLKKTEHRKKLFYEALDPSDALKDWIESYIDIKYYTALLEFPLRYCNYNRLNYNDWEAPNNYYPNLNDIADLVDKATLCSDLYPLIGGYIWKYLPKQYGYDSDLHNLDSVLLSNMSRIRNRTFKELLTGAIFFTYLNVDSITRFDNNRNIFENDITLAYIKQPLETYYTEKKQSLNKNAFSNQTEIIELKSDTNILKQIIADHQGSHIYIDFWAPWCNPCLSELPFSKSLFTIYSFTNLEFVFVCLDSEKDKWQQKLKELQIPGRHYYCNKAQSNAIRKELGITQIPYYTFVNKSGDIEEKGNHLLPSIPLTRKKINKLLQP